MKEIYLLTGGNIGDRLQYLQKAAYLIEKTIGRLVKASSIYETAAWGFTDQGTFLNQVLNVHSDLPPDELLYKLLDIELELGRKRLQKMGPRVIDIDILFYDEQVICTPNLTIPHPRIAERRFVLTPLNQIAPDFIHPVFKLPVNQLLLNCNDQLEVHLFND